MFKKLKEKIENEDKYGPANEHGDPDDDRDSDRERVNTSRRLVLRTEANNRSLDGYNTDDSMASNSVVVVNNGVNNADNHMVSDSEGNSDDNVLKTKRTGDGVDPTDRLSALADELVRLKAENQSLDSRVGQLTDENHVLSARLTDTTEECRQLRTQLTDYQSIGGEKDELLMRNAELSSRCQQLQLELQSERRERSELTVRYDQMASETAARDQNDRLVAELNATINRLEETAVDKNKTIKLQQQRLHDMKKTFLANQSAGKGGGAGVGLALLGDEFGNTSSGDERSPKHQSYVVVRNESKTSAIGGNVGSAGGVAQQPPAINFEYLRNVVLKYMCSSDYEVAAHLVRAISVLLEFTAEEELLVKQTIAWKMSWIAPLVAPKPSLTPHKK